MRREMGSKRISNWIYVAASRRDGVCLVYSRCQPCGISSAATNDTQGLFYYFALDRLYFLFATKLVILVRGVESFKLLATRCRVPHRLVSDFHRDVTGDVAIHPAGIDFRSSVVVVVVGIFLIYKRIDVTQNLLFFPVPPPPMLNHIASR